MSDQSKVDIVISTKAELAGAQQALNALEKQIVKAKALNKEYAALEQAAKKVQAAIAAGQKRMADSVASSSEADIKRKLSAAWYSDVANKTRNSGSEEQAKLKALWDGQLANESHQRKVIQQQGLDNLGVSAGTLANNVTKKPGVLGTLLGGGMSGWASMAAKVSLALGGLYAAVKALVPAFREYASAQAKVASLDIALAQRGQLNDKYRESLQRLADTLEKSTKIDSEEWIGVLKTLTQAGADSTNINQLAEAVKNLAGILGGDVSQAAFMVGRALNGSYQAFGRMGIEIDENATQSQKLNKLFGELALRGGGQLEHMGRTIQGQFKGLGTAFRNLLKETGGWIAATGLVQGATDIATKAMDGLANAIKSPEKRLNGLKNAALETKAGMEGLADAQERLLKITVAWATAEKKIDDILNQRKSLIEQKEAADIEQLGAKRDLIKAQLEMIRSKGFVTSKDLRALQSAGLLSAGMIQEANSSGGRVGEAFWLNAEYLLGQQHRRGVANIKTSSAKETEKAYTEQKGRLASSRDQQITKIEQADERIAAAKKLEELKLLRGKALSESEAAYRDALDTKRLPYESVKELLDRTKKSSQIYANLKWRAYEIGKDISAIQQKYPGLGDSTAETQNRQALVAGKNELDKSISEFSNTMNTTTSSMRKAIASMNELNKTLSATDTVNVQAGINEELTRRVRNLEGQLNNLRNR